MSRPEAPDRGAARRRDERGAGLVSTAITSVAVLAVVLLATHVLLALQRRSTVSAVAFDTARRVALDDPLTVLEAEQRARRLLGDPQASMEWSATDDAVSLRVVTRAASILPSVGPLRPLTHIERTVTVRREALR